MKYSSSEISHFEYVAALSDKTPVYLLEKLANHNASLIRELIARNPKTPISTLELLKNKAVKDRESIKQWRITCNNPFAEDNRGLAELEGLAKNPNCPREILKEIVELIISGKASYSHLLIYIYDNKNSDKEILELIFKNKHLIKEYSNLYKNLIREY